MDIVIVGSGKVGFSLAEQLVREEHNVTIIDNDEEALHRAGDQLDVMTVRGNGVATAALREAGAPCKVMVGGAVVTQSFADKIGADYYTRDAAQSARVAAEVFGK